MPAGTMHGTLCCALPATVPTRARDAMPAADVGGVTRQPETDYSGARLVVVPVAIIVF